MKGGLLDFIFEKVKIEELDRSGVLSYNIYIAEIYQQNLTIEQRIRYQNVNIRLGARLMQLDREGVTKIVKPSSKT